MKKITFLFSVLITIVACHNQTIKNLTDDQVVEKIFKTAESGNESYDNLKFLTTNFTKRLACYPQSIEAAKWAREIMSKMDLDTVFLQEAKVMGWSRGNIEIGKIINNGEAINVNVCALGRGIGTGENGIEAGVVEVNGLDDLSRVGKEEIQGKIVFFNQAMNPELESPFQAYGEAAGQRFMGPIMAAEYGAVGVVVRSLTTSIDEFPHTGTTRKAFDVATVPSICIATKHANLLSKLIKENSDLKFYFQTNCENRPDTITYNSIGELRGSEYPNEYIVVGGHLDAWDNSPGAHDDGGGCMQAIEVLRIFKEIGYTPKHSIRAVMYMDEEVSQGGGKAYAEQAKLHNEKHIFAIESDRGVTKPLGFSFEASPEILEKIASWKTLFEPYDIKIFVQGGGGVDIDPLKNGEIILSGLLTDPTHYFDWHHSANDTFDHINRIDMQNGAAAMAALIYLIDKYGLD